MGDVMCGWGHGISQWCPYWLTAEGLRVSHKRVARIWRQEGQGVSEAALEGAATEQDYHTASGALPYSLRLTGANPEAKAYWSNYRSGTEIPITPGKTYTYSGLVEADLATGAQATISLHFFTKEDRWAAIPGLEAEWDGKVAALEGKRDWTRLTVSCQAPENAAKAVLFFSLKGQGQAWLSSAEFGESQK